MVANGQDYELLRNLDLLTDDVALKTPDMLQVARQQAKKKISESHAANARVYNLRSRTVQLHVGDTVFVRSFAQSNAAKKFSSKLAPVFIKASVTKKISPTYYELTNEANKSLGVYHLKDIRT